MSSETASATTSAGLTHDADTSIRGYAELLRAVVVKRFLLLVRYPVNTITQYVTLLLLFLVMFYGGSAIAPAAITETLDGIIVGFLLWSLSIASYAGLSWNVTREAQWGTLEQLFMSPFGFGRVMAAKTVANVLESFLSGSIILGLMLLITGRTMALDPLTVIPIGLLAVAPAIGIGFVFGGLAIRFKRIENAFQLVQFVFIGLIAAPVDQYQILKWLPLAQGSRLLHTAMADGVALWNLPTGELAVLVITAVGYLAIGYAIFGYCQRWARREGVMGHY